MLLHHHLRMQVIHYEWPLEQNGFAAAAYCYKPGLIVHRVKLTSGAVKVA